MLLQLAVAAQIATGAVIDGVVADTALNPLGDVSVSIVGGDARVVTGSNGRFRILGVRPGAYVVLARKVGFEPASARVEVGASDTARVSIELEPVVTSLSEARVTGVAMSPKMAEFEQRRHLGNGQYVTRDEIEKRNVFSVSGLLGPMRGLQVVPMTSPTAPPGVVAANRRARGGTICPFTIFVDGVQAPSSYLDQLPSPKEIAGIEVYSGPSQIPIEYKRPGIGFCGLILIWLRDGP